MCIGPVFFDAHLLEHFLSRRPRLHRYLLRVYFRYVRICRVILRPDPAELDACRVDVCDCRLLRKGCENRLDLCFKVDPAAEREPRAPGALLQRSDEAASQGLVRLRVTSLGTKTEYCHCCACCCQALAVARRLGPGYLVPSDALPETSLRCLRCGLCVSSCPVGARGAGEVDPARCIGCGVCVNACRRGAIEMRARPADGLARREARSLPPLLLKILAFVILVYVGFANRKHPHGHVHPSRDGDHRHRDAA